MGVPDDGSGPIEPVPGEQAVTELEHQSSDPSVEAIADVGPVVIGWQGARKTTSRALDVYGSAISKFLLLGSPVAVLSVLTVLLNANPILLGVIIIAELSIALVAGAAMMLMTDDIERGAEPTISDVLRRAKGRFIPLVLQDIAVIAAIVGVMALGGIVAVVGAAVGSASGGGTTLPAIVVAVIVTTLAVSYLAFRWAVGSQAVVLDGESPMTGLRHSWSVTRRHFWRLVRLGIVLSLWTMLAIAGSSALMEYASNRALAGFGQAVASLVTAPLLAITLAIVYRDLAGRHAGAHPTASRGRGRPARIAVLGGGIVILAAGIWAFADAGGRSFAPDRGQVLAGTQRNPLDECRPLGIKTVFSASEAVWLAEIFTTRIPPGDDVEISYIRNGTVLGSVPVTAGPSGLDCSFEDSPISGVEAGIYRITARYRSNVVADGSFEVKAQGLAVTAPADLALVLEFGR